MAFVDPLTQPVGLAVVVEHPGRLLEPAQRHDELDSLVPGNRTILVVVENQQRRLDLVGPENRRVLHVSQRNFPQAGTQATLGLLVLKLPHHAALPTDTSVSAGHVGHRRASLGGGEDIRLRHHVGNLVTAP